MQTVLGEDVVEGKLLNNLQNGARVQAVVVDVALSAYLDVSSLSRN